MSTSDDFSSRFSFYMQIIGLSFLISILALQSMLAQPLPQYQGKIMTVNGPVEPTELGAILPHEHVLVDFIGADSVSKSRYDRDAAAAAVTPFLQDLVEVGGKTLIECTPNYLGRDPILLKQLSKSTGLHLLTNTGYYGDEAGKFLPGHVYELSAEEVSKIWTKEWKNGIYNTGIKPGFIKLRIDRSPISEVGQKLLQAASLTHKASGLTIGIHTANGKTALRQLEILKSHGIDPSAFIWIHAQNESDTEIHKQIARQGAWVEFDGVGEGSLESHLKFLQQMKNAGLLNRVLISQDAGWYRVGEPGGAMNKFTSYTFVFTHFIPQLKQKDFTADEIDMLIRQNPQHAFTITKRIINE